MSNYPMYSEISLTDYGEVTQNTNEMPWIREEIFNILSSGYESPEWFSIDIGAVDIRSSASFLVRLNPDTYLSSVDIGGTYVVQYEGAVTEMVFMSDATIDFVWVAYKKTPPKYATINIYDASESGDEMSVYDFAHNLLFSADPSDAVYEMTDYYPYYVNIPESNAYYETNVAVRLSDAVEGTITINREAKGGE